MFGGIAPGRGVRMNLGALGPAWDRHPNRGSVWSRALQSGTRVSSQRRRMVRIPLRSPTVKLRMFRGRNGCVCASLLKLGLDPWRFLGYWGESH
jgi:hypothetical protein